MSPGHRRGIYFCQMNDWYWDIWMCWTQLRCLKNFLPRRFRDMGFWLGMPPTPGDKFLSNKWLILANLTLGNASPPVKNFLPCCFWDTASDWERHLNRGINCCQINDWFWVIWSWEIHPRNWKKFILCRFWDTAFDLERPLCRGINCLSKNDWFWVIWRCWMYPSPLQFVWYWQVGG